MAEMFQILALMAVPACFLLTIRYLNLREARLNPLQPTEAGNPDA